MAAPQQESMYMYLASVDCTHLFSNNTPASFRSKLPQPLYFENPNDWEIGLKSYIGPVLHANLEQGTSIFMIHHQNEYSSDKQVPVIEEFKIPDIYYHSIDDLILTINQACYERGRAIRLTVENDTVSVIVEEANCGILFKTYIARILGFKEAVFIFSNFSVITNDQCFKSTKVDIAADADPNHHDNDELSDYEESDPAVAEEILTRREGTTVYVTDDEEEDDDDPNTNTNTSSNLLLRIGNRKHKIKPKHSSTFLINHNAKNCLYLLANSTSRPFNTIFQNELNLLTNNSSSSSSSSSKGNGSQVQLTFHFDDEPTCKNMGVGKFQLESTNNFNHSSIRYSSSLNYTEHALFFNVYANAGGVAITADYKSQLSTRLPLFWVYLDCIIDQITGNGASPVLRTIPLSNVPNVNNNNNNNNNDQSMTKISVLNFDDPYYVELNKRYIDVISCEICMENGKPVKFPQGSRTLLVLHLRKRQRNLFTTL